MFLSGLEIDFTAFKGKKKKEVLPNGKKEPNSFIVATLIFIGIFAISLGVVVPTLKEAHLMKTVIGQIILLVAVIADLATMFLLAVFVSIYDNGNGNTWLLLVLFAAGVGLYFVGRRFKNRKFLEAMSTGTVQIGTRAVFTLILLLVAVSETVGAENILGAFLAGVKLDVWSLLGDEKLLLYLSRN